MKENISSRGLPRTMLFLGLTILVIFLMAGLIIFKIKFTAREKNKNTTPWPELLSEVRLKPERAPLKKGEVAEDNAFFVLQNLITKNVNRADQNEFRKFFMLGLKGNNYPKIEEWLTLNHEILEVFWSGAEYEKCQVVPLRSLLDNNTISINAFQSAKASCYQAEKQTAKGSWDEMYSTYRSSLVSLDHLSRGSPMYERISFISATIMVCTHLENLSLKYSIPDKELEKLIKLLDDLERKTEPFAESMRQERVLFVNSIPALYHDTEKVLASQMVSEGDAHSAKRDRIFNMAIEILKRRGTPENTEKNFNALFSHYIAIAEGPYDHDRMQSEVMAWVNGLKGDNVYYGDDPLGRLLTAFDVCHFDHECKMFYTYLARLRMTRIILALELYKRKHDSKLPKELAGLEPYLGKIPTDPFSKGGLQFEYLKKLIPSDSGQPQEIWILVSRGVDQKIMDCESHLTHLLQQLQGDGEKASAEKLNDDIVCSPLVSELYRKYYLLGK